MDSGIQPTEREKPKAFGLKGLQERARSVGGWLDVSSRSGEGTSITLTIPLTSQPAGNYRMRFNDPSHSLR